MSKAYTDYIITHVQNTVRAYAWLKHRGIITKDLTDRIMKHDASKYSNAEFEPYDAYFYGERTPEVVERFNYAWLHHIHANDHHWQHWVLINDEDGTVALEMPEDCVYEMICDWWSFSHKIGNLYSMFDWYTSHKDLMILHPNTRALVEKILTDIKIALEVEGTYSE